MHLSTRFTRTVAAAMSVAALAAVGAGPASAAGTVDPVGPLNGVGASNDVGYGNGWANGLVSGSANLEWNENAAGTITTPRLVAPGNIYIETPGVQARMQIEHYSDAAHTTDIATRDGGTKVGDPNSFLSVKPIVLGGVTSGTTHVHVNLQKRINGVWTTIASSVENL